MHIVRVYDPKRLDSLEGREICLYPGNVAEAFWINTQGNAANIFRAKYDFLYLNGDRIDVCDEIEQFMSRRMAPALRFPVSDSGGSFRHYARVAERGSREARRRYGGRINADAEIVFNKALLCEMWKD